jgi:hypothetical protein
MSTPMSHHPLVPLGSRRVTWFVVGGLAIAGLIVALALTLSGSKSANPVRAVPAPAVASPAPAAASAVPKAGFQAPDRARFQHGFPSLNPQGKLTSPRHSATGVAAPSGLHYPRNYPPYIDPAKHGNNHPGGR